jgi:hypothetical protein
LFEGMLWSFFNKYRTEVCVGFHLHDVLVIFI